MEVGSSWSWRELGQAPSRSCRRSRQRGLADNRRTYEGPIVLMELIETYQQSEPGQ